MHEHRPVPAHVFPFRQLAAACRLGDFRQGEAFRQGELILAAPAPDAAQLFAVNQAAKLGSAFRQQPGGKRPHEQILHPGIAQDNVQGVAALRHGPLAQHLAGNDAARPVAFHARLRFAQHEDFTVHAGIQRLAETMNRPLRQKAGHAVPDIHRINVQAEAFLPIRNLPGLAEKRRHEMQASYLQALCLNKAYGKNAVQAA